MKEIIEEVLASIKEKSNPKMWNKSFKDKVIEYITEIVGKYGYNDVFTLVSVDGNYIELRPKEKKKICKVKTCYPVYEITYNPKLSTINFIVEKRSYVNINEDNIPDVSIYSSSEIYNKDNVLEYHSRYYDMFTLDRKISIDEFIDKTDCRYENGRFLTGPFMKSNPEIDKSFRFQRSNVILETTNRHGVEKTSIELTLDDDNQTVIHLLNKVDGKYYDDEQELTDNILDIVKNTDKIYEKCKNNFIKDNFLDLFHQYTGKKK